MKNTGKVDSKGRAVFESARGATFVMIDGKKRYVKTFFSPKKNTPPKTPPRVEFTCGSSGLRQTSGTCWFNASLNGIVLASATGRDLFDKIRALNEVQLHGLENMNIKDSCPRELSKKYVYAYALRMHGAGFANQDENESVRLIGKLFTPGRLSNGIARGENGYRAVFALEKILSRVFASKSIKVIKNETDAPLNFDFVVLDDKTKKKPSDFVPIIRHKTIRDIEYDLTHLVYVVRPAGSTGSHASVAYVCDGKSYVYDSNNKKAKKIDWFDSANDDAILKYNHASAFATIDYALYVRRTA